MRVLIAEDDPDLLPMLMFCLEKQGWEVVGAEDGREALYRYHQSIHEEHYFDLIVMDVGMPRLNGFAMGLNIRNLEKFGDVPKAVHVYLSGYNDIVPPQELVDSLFADAYFRKPFDAQTFIADIIKLIADAGVAKRKTDSEKQSAAVI